MQPHANPSKCLHANFGVQICKHHFRVLAQFPVSFEVPSDVKRGGGMTALLPVMFGHETQLRLIFIKYFPSCAITFTYICFSYNPVTYITLAQL